MKRYYTILFIVIIGAALRSWGLDFGLPYQFHQDEPIVINHALAYGTGDLNPHFFIVPPLASYILFGCYVLYFLAVNMLGVCIGMEEFSLSFFRDPTPFYMIGRMILGVLPSVASIYLTYELAKKFVSKKAALYAALAMAVTFLNVVNAHYSYTDNLLVLFVLLAYLAMARLMDSRKTADYVIAGVITGLAISTKYNAVLLLVPFLLVHLIGIAKDGGKNLVNTGMIVFIGIVIITFIISNPYSVLDGRFFLESISRRIRGGYWGFGHHIRYSLFEGMGPIPAILGIAGLAWSLKRDFKKAAFLISFPVIFYIHLVFKSQPFPRYVLPLIPFIAIGLSILLSELYENARTKTLKAAVYIVFIALIAPTTAKSVKADMLFAGKDTRIEAKEWIEKNIRPGTRIALASTFFSPPLPQTIGQLKEKESIVPNQPELKHLKSRKMDLLIRSRQPGESYEVYYLKGDNEAPGQFLNLWPMIGNDFEGLRNNGVRYIVFNNMDTSKEVAALHNEISGRFSVVATFSPYKDKGSRPSYDMIELTCMPADTREIFSRRAAGPYLVIYRIK